MENENRRVSAAYGGDRPLPNNLWTRAALQRIAEAAFPRHMARSHFLAVALGRPLPNGPWTRHFLAVALCRPLPNGLWTRHFLAIALGRERPWRLPALMPLPMLALAQAGRRIVRFGLTLALLIFAALSTSLLAQEPASESTIDARLTEVEGEVTVFYHDHVEDGVVAQADVPLAVGDKVKTGPDSRAEIGLDGDSVIELGANSEFVIDSLQRQDSGFSLGLGWLVAKVRSMVADQGKMQVRTPVAVAAVRGTEFGVEHDADGTSHIGVFDDGRVAVSALDAGPGGAETLIGANQEASMRPGFVARQLEIRSLDRFQRRQAIARRVRSRVLVMRKTWRRLPLERRLELRRRSFERSRRLLREIRHKRRRLKQEGMRGPGESRERRRQERPRRGPRERGGSP